MRNILITFIFYANNSIADDHVSDKEIIKKAIISYHLNLLMNHCCVAAVKTKIPINEVTITIKAFQILSTPINKSS